MNIYSVENRLNDNRLKVTGTGTISASPDQVQLTLGVITENTSVSTAQSENATRISAILNALAGLGVPENQIQTVAYRIDPQYDYIDGIQVFRNYRVAHLLEITLDNVGITGNVVDVAVEHGANSIASIDFSIRDPATVYNQALAKAIENARLKATAITNTLAVTLCGIPLYVKELTNMIYPRNHMVLTATTETPIQAGALAIIATIEAEFCYT